MDSQSVYITLPIEQSRLCRCPLCVKRADIDLSSSHSAQLSRGLADIYPAGQNGWGQCKRGFLLGSFCLEPIKIYKLHSAERISNKQDHGSQLHPNLGHGRCQWVEWGRRSVNIYSLIVPTVHKQRILSLPVSALSFPLLLWPGTKLIMYDLCLISFSGVPRLH